MVPRFPPPRALELRPDEERHVLGDRGLTSPPLDAKKTWMQNEIDMEKAIALHEKRFQGEKGINRPRRHRIPEAANSKRKYRLPNLTPEVSEILIKRRMRWNNVPARGKFKSYEARPTELR